MAWKPKFPPDPPMRNRPPLDPLIVLAVVTAIVVIVIAAGRLGGRFLEDAGLIRSSGVTGPSPPASIIQGSMSGLTVIDGDTVRAGGATYRLVGFDTPERGDRALCDAERELAEKSAARLQSLIAAGQFALERVACACTTGTEGTQACEYGRSCAYLKVNGTDVGETLVREGLAHPFVCGRTSCPPRRPWC
jgi:endonuclease YncB( thermonuclease family)